MSLPILIRRIAHCSRHLQDINVNDRLPPPSLLIPPLNSFPNGLAPLAPRANTPPMLPRTRSAPRYPLRCCTPPAEAHHWPRADGGVVNGHRSPRRPRCGRNSAGVQFSCPATSISHVFVVIEESNLLYAPVNVHTVSAGMDSSETMDL